jgi:ATP-dependent protease Clp ATPase subunit
VNEAGGVIDFAQLDKQYGCALYRICCWVAARLFVHPNNVTSFNNTLIIYGNNGSGKTYITLMLAKLFDLYEDTIDATGFAAPAMLKCTGRVLNEARFD